jgi:hypothetical protein
MRFTPPQTDVFVPSAHAIACSSAGVPAAERFSPAEALAEHPTHGVIELEIEADVSRRARPTTRRDGIATVAPTVR